MPRGQNSTNVSGGPFYGVGNKKAAKPRSTIQIEVCAECHRLGDRLLHRAKEVGEQYSPNSSRGRGSAGRKRASATPAASATNHCDVLEALLREDAQGHGEQLAAPTGGGKAGRHSYVLGAGPGRRRVADPSVPLRGHARFHALTDNYLTVTVMHRRCVDDGHLATLRQTCGVLAPITRRGPARGRPGRRPSPRSRPRSRAPAAATRRPARRRSWSPPAA